MKEQAYIQYLAHMLDESFGSSASYWQMFVEEHPECDPDGNELKYSMLRAFDDYLVKRFPDLDERLEKMAKLIIYETDDRIPYEEDVALVLAAFKPDTLTNHEYFWDVIPAQTYKAIVSRNRAVMQGQASRNVSPKTVKDCLDSMCSSAAKLIANDDIVPSESETYERVLKIVQEVEKTAPKSIIDNADRKRQGIYRGATGRAKTITDALYNACYSIVDLDELSLEFGQIGMSDEEDWDENFDKFEKARAKLARQGAGDWMTKSSDSGLGQYIVETMKKADCMIYEKPEDAIPLLSQLIDRIHIRGDLAGAFVQGGSKTCSQVSNMEPDEIYE